jgi:hypothetical protein
VIYLVSVWCFNNLLPPRLADSGGVPFAFWFGAILCGVSQGSAPDGSQDDKMNLIEKENDNEEDEEEQVKMSEALNFPLPFWILVVSCVVVYGCVLPFNNIASSLLLERDFFQEPDSSCRLLIPYECQGDGNIPVDCPSSKWYQPPLPYNVTINGEYYATLEDSDIDCGDDDWSEDGACTYEYCKRQEDGIQQVRHSWHVMSCHVSSMHDV